jgi:hypothetical protein
VDIGFSSGIHKHNILRNCILQLAVNYKQLHKDLSIRLYSDATMPVWEQEQLKQRLHYIEVEFDYRPRYKQSDLRPRCKDSRSSKPQRHKHSKHSK